MSVRGFRLDIPEATIDEAGVPVLEHLTNLGKLPAQGARLHAVPPRVREVGTFPVRAYAVVNEPRQPGMPQKSRLPGAVIFLRSSLGRRCLLMAIREVTVTTEVGIQARPATEFVDTAATSKSEVSITKAGRGMLDAKSILHVLSLDIRPGDTITLESDDEDILNKLHGLADPSTSPKEDPDSQEPVAE